MIRDPDPVVRARIRGGFWGGRLAVNAESAIFHQWRQLEETGCVENFRIAAGRSRACRSGLFFSDSDAYKWLEAAACILANHPDDGLAARVDEFIDLLAAAQSPDGYLFTYNQIHFPGERWVNLQIEHEMYCLGHLIEAGVSDYLARRTTRLLDIARRAADLLVREFLDASPERNDGHEEVELALLRLYRCTAEPRYLELARRLLERRGRIPRFARLMLTQALSTARRWRTVARRRRRYREAHPEEREVRLPPPNRPRIPPVTWLRLAVDLLSGRNFQQHLPIRLQQVPVGHAVRFTYLATAAAMLCRESPDDELRSALEQAWRRMVSRRMYVTGGLGSLPLIEGFGRDYELEPEVAYAETCAAIGCVRWNQAMGALTGDACYDDLLEWQLYNAVAVGMGSDGRSYLYNNPLTCRGNITRVPWYLVPCCPSNLSRTWASLADALVRPTAEGLQITQYVSGEVEFGDGCLSIDSELPWNGCVRLGLQLDRPRTLTLDLRLPSWAGEIEIHVNQVPDPLVAQPGSGTATACGYSPTAAGWHRLRREWRSGDLVELRMTMPIRALRQDSRIPGCGGMSAIARGPLVYCLEDVDNPGDLFDVTLDGNSLIAERDDTLLGGIVRIAARSTDGALWQLIPYHLWGNRGPSQMTTFVRLPGDIHGIGVGIHGTPTRGHMGHPPASDPDSD